jgi:hypothetical protein
MAASEKTWQTNLKIGGATRLAADGRTATVEGSAQFVSNLKFGTKI